MKEAILLVNLGTPEAPEESALKPYLQEFLMDPRALNRPFPLRWYIVNRKIVPKRAKRSAEAYAKVWMEEGSPLMVISKKQREKLEEATGIPVYLAMRYGSPSIADEVKKIKQAGIHRLFIIPLYPQYAMSSYETAVVRVTEELKNQGLSLEFATLQPYYKDEDYIASLAESMQDYIKDDMDQLLLSFHGVPLDHLTGTDCSKAHCQTVKNCCEVASPAHATCYMHQCFSTAKALRQKLGLPEDKVTVSFQSRLGREPWTEPATDNTLKSFPQKGIKNIAVACPGFVADCLETLEEIDMEGRETFLEAGGSTFTFIPCVNDRPSWIRFLAGRVKKWQEGALVTSA